MEKIKFEQFFERLLEDEKFRGAYEAISNESERSMVRDFCARAFGWFSVGDSSEIADKYLQEICGIVGDPRNQIKIGSVGLIEGAAYVAGNHLPKKYNMVANA